MKVRPSVKKMCEKCKIIKRDVYKRQGQVWIKIFPDKPITEKPAETRMGSGKGSPEYWEIGRAHV